MSNISTWLSRILLSIPDTTSLHYSCTYSSSLSASGWCTAQDLFPLHHVGQKGPHITACTHTKPLLPGKKIRSLGSVHWTRSFLVRSVSRLVTAEKFGINLPASPKNCLSPFLFLDLGQAPITVVVSGWGSTYPWPKWMPRYRTSTHPIADSFVFAVSTAHLKDVVNGADIHYYKW